MNEEESMPEETRKLLEELEKEKPKEEIEIIEENKEKIEEAT